MKFKYSLDNKRYHTLNYFLKSKFHTKVMKISLNAGFNCPNIDGTKGYGGCIYCSNGSGDFAGKKEEDLKTQFYNVKKMMEKKWPNAKCIAYFQANTNTYAPVSILKEKYESVLNLDGVVGLDIATRSDAITDECLDYLEELNKRTFLIVELGLQTIHDRTSKLINRCNSLDNFTDMVKKLREKKINVVVHIINGLPGETKEDMLETVKYLNRLDIQGIKIHMLSVVKGTPLAKMYEENHFHVLTEKEYVDIVINQLELLREEIVINRITGDPKKEDLIEPNWLLKKFQVIDDIDKEMVKRNVYQGDKAEKLNSN